MRKTLSLLLAVTMLLVAVVTAAPALAADEEITLSFTNTYTEEQISTNADTAARAWAITNFNENNVGKVKIETLSLSNEDYAIKAQAQAAADDLPDLFLVKGSWMENFEDNELMADLTDAYNALPYKDDYYAGEFKSSTVNGKIYGVPVQFVQATSLMFCNTKLWKDAGYDEIPSTFAEVFQAAQKFNEMGIATMALGNKEEWSYESCWLSCLGDRFTGTEWFEGILARDGSSKFTDDNFVAALQFTKDLGQSGVLNPDFNSINHNESISLYNQGKAASVVSGYWSVSNIVANATDEVRENTVIRLLPQPQGASVGSPTSLSNSSGWFVSVNNKLTGAKREAAIAAAFAINGPDYVNYLAENYAQLGPIKAAFMPTEGVDPLTAAYTAIASENATSGVPVYDVQLNGAIVDVMNRGLQEVLAGTLEPEVLAQRIQAEQEALE